MKKIKKITALLLLMFMMLSLCSCAELEVLKDKQAFFNENGIIYKDTLYKPIYVADNLNFSDRKSLNVTDPGVPVLASTLIDFNYSINNDETIIRGGYDGEWYVREDKYSQYEQSVKNGVDYTDFGFSYFDFDLGKDVDYILSESEKQAVLSLLSTEPITPEHYDYFYEELLLFEQSDDALFRKNYIYSVVCSEGPDADGSYYLVIYDNENEENITWDITKVYASTPDTDKIFEEFFDKGYDIPGYNG